MRWNQGPGTRFRIALVTALLVAGAGVARTAAADPPSTPAVDFPSYDHVFLIVEENHGYAQIIGNPAAPHLNQLTSPA